MSFFVVTCETWMLKDRSALFIAQGIALKPRTRESPVNTCQIVVVFFPFE